MRGIATFAGFPGANWRPAPRNRRAANTDAATFVRARIAILLAAGLVPAPALAQACGGVASEVTVDPSRPRAGTNYHSISGALCAVKSAADAPGTIIISAHGGRPYREHITVSKSSLTIKAALGETVTVAPPRARCVTLDSAGATTLRGLAFRPSPGAGACIDVRAGTLLLGNSRVDLPDASATAIHIAAAATLEFTGDSYDRHGVFRRVAPGLPQGAVGIRADAASTLRVNNVRIENLSAGVESRATVNEFTRVRFTGNLTSIALFDEGETPPALTIASGEFLGGGTAIRLIAGAPGADRANPYRGKVTIGASDGGLGERVLFYRNAMAFETDASAFALPLEITNADFTENFVHALRFPLPEGASAAIKASTFSSNGLALAIAGPLDGSLAFDGRVDGGPENRGIEIGHGAGALSATLASVSGPAIAFGGAFLENGTHNVVIETAAEADFLAISPESSLCEAGAGNDWKAFRQSLAGLKISVAGEPYIKAVSGSARPSKKKLREAYYIVCAPPLEG